MAHIIKNQDYQIKVIFTFIIILIATVLKFPFYILFLLEIFCLILYISSTRKINKQIEYLSKCCDSILDSNHFDIIDGEGPITVLSHKIYVLNKRYQTSLNQIQLEQKKLKEYVENISHQLKTPLTSMKTNIELMIENDINNKKLNSIMQAIETMNYLVNNLLTLSLVDSHSITYNKEECSLKDLINQVCKELHYLIVKTNNKIECLEDINIVCDEKWMKEALKNIIKNCLEKNKNKTITIQVQKHQALISITIEDHGVGINHDDLPYLFERFYKSKDSKGIGIGLALSKEIIEGHLGNITASNREGACFEISLPIANVKKKF